MISRVPAANRLLVALPRAACPRVFAESKPLILKLGEVLYEPGSPIEYVYFPIDCVMSVLATVEGGNAMQVGLIGYEGMLGVSVVLGVTDSFVRAVVHTSGTALRIKTARFRKEFLRSRPLQRALYCYANARLALLRQAVACQCFHRAEARLACCLLMTSDRVRSEEFHQLQNSLAAMLGMQRATVSVCAGRLQQRKIISYSRGKIRILNRNQLEAAACDCYQYGKILNTLSDRVPRIETQRADYTETPSPSNIV
jgi:CRP-like cAMP-binding protein